MKFLDLLLASVFLHAVSALTTRPPSSTYHYFAFGSNMVESTLTALRQVKPLNATAAILPDYRLRFNIGGGGRLDGAAASVEAAPGRNEVHGVLYELTPDDFAKVGLTEGVPLAYRWQQCRVYPYVGDGESAGKTAVSDASSDEDSVMAFTLVKSFPSMFGKNSDDPPSRSYLDLLIQGAEEWKMDKSFRQELEATPVARNLLLTDGLAGPMLKLAELRQRKSSC